MWLCMNDSFLSIVEKDCGAGEFVVGGGGDGEIERVFPNATVEVTLGNDYRCRARVKRADVAVAISGRVMDIGYSNFKGSTRDDELHDAYMGAWHAFGKLQPGGPYSAGLRRQPKAAAKSRVPRDGEL